MHDAERAFQQQREEHLRQEVEELKEIVRLHEEIAARREQLALLTSGKSSEEGPPEKDGGTSNDDDYHGGAPPPVTQGSYGPAPPQSETEAAKIYYTPLHSGRAERIAQIREWEFTRSRASLMWEPDPKNPVELAEDGWPTDIHWIRYRVMWDEGDGAEIKPSWRGYWIRPSPPVEDADAPKNIKPKQLPKSQRKGLEDFSIIRELAAQAADQVDATIAKRLEKEPDSILNGLLVDPSRATSPQDVPQALREWLSTHEYAGVWEGPKCHAGPEFRGQAARLPEDTRVSVDELQAWVRN